MRHPYAFPPLSKGLLLTLCLLLPWGASAAPSPSGERPRSADGGQKASVPEGMTALERASIHLNLALAYQGEGLNKDAQREFEAALALKPDFSFARNLLANLFAKTGRLDEAVAELKKAVERDPSDTESFFDLGRFQLLQGHFEEALASFETVLKQDPDSVTAQTLIGNLRMAQGKLKEAELAYLKALGMEPRYAAAHNELGNLYLRRGDKEGARSEFLRALELDPGLSVARKNLESLLPGGNQ